MSRWRVVWPLEAAIGLVPRASADAGDWDAPWRLVKVLAARGDIDGLRQELQTGNSQHALFALLDFYSGGDPERRRELDRYGLDVDGYPAAPW